MALRTRLEGNIDSFLGEPRFHLQEIFSEERFPNVVVALDGTAIATWGARNLVAPAGDALYEGFEAGELENWWRVRPGASWKQEDSEVDFTLDPHISDRRGSFWLPESEAQWCLGSCRKGVCRAIDELRGHDLVLP